MDCGTCSPGSWIVVGIVEHLKAFLLRSTEFSHSSYPAEELAHKVLVKRERQERVRQIVCGKIFYSLLLILCECKPVAVGQQQCCKVIDLQTMWLVLTAASTHTQTRAHVSV